MRVDHKPDHILLQKNCISSANPNFTFNGVMVLLTLKKNLSSFLKPISEKVSPSNFHRNFYSKIILSRAVQLMDKNTNFKSYLLHYVSFYLPEDFESLFLIFWASFQNLATNVVLHCLICALVVFTIVKLI